MNIDKDEVTIITTIIGFLSTAFLGGRAYEKLKASDQALSDRLQNVETKPPVMTMAECEIRRIECEKRNKLQFDAGEKMFVEIKKLIADNDRASNERHDEIMRVLLEMNKQ
jgi:hypothetical protein